MYDYLIVGAGFYGATFARMATDAGKTCLVIDARQHVAGNAYSENMQGIEVHMYGPHIFHTSNSLIWDFVNRYATFNNFRLSPKAYNNGRMYSLPFNMNTFHEMWGVVTPEQAKEKINSQTLKLTARAKNLEEEALSQVGYEVYETLIRDYTIKQWQKNPCDLPASIIRRLPIRFTYDNNYFNDLYQGIPMGNGYTGLIQNMLDGIQVELGVDYFKARDKFDALAQKVVFTGRIDEFFNYRYGALEYRTLDFKHRIFEGENRQGCAIINYTGMCVPYTRTVEHSHFRKSGSSVSVVTTETPGLWHRDAEPFYPVNDDINDAIYNVYKQMAKSTPNIIFGGRLAEYKYYDMHQVIASARHTIMELED